MLPALSYFRNTNCTQPLFLVLSPVPLDGPRVSPDGVGWATEGPRYQAGWRLPPSLTWRKPILFNFVGDIALRIPLAGKEIQLFVRLYKDLCNVPLYQVPCVRLQIRLTKAKSSLYVKKNTVYSKIFFKFLDTQLLVSRARRNLALLIAHNTTLRKGSLAR